MERDFTAIPVVDLSLAQSHETKSRFLSELRQALVHVGFFYVRSHSISEQVQQDAIQRSIAFFDLPLERKLEIEIVHSKHFLGYNRIGAEKTASETDYNESITLGSDVSAPAPDEPAYLNMRGPSQWPDEAAVPGFRKAIGDYCSAVQNLATDLMASIAQALDLPTTSLSRLFDDCPFSRLKVIKYPPPSKQATAERSRRGIGAHTDTAFMTFLLQGGRQNCLEVQNKSGAWIPVPPIPGTLVVNIGRLLETLTRGVCTATTHRVEIKTEGFTDQSGKPLGPRISIPFFQYTNLRLIPDNLSLEIPTHITDLVKDENVISDAEHTFSGLFNNCVGDAIFTNMLTSYQEAATKWYPDLLPLAIKVKSEEKQLSRQRQKSAGQRIPVSGQL